MIYINARFLTQNITGVQRFAIEISRKLKKMKLDIIWLSPINILPQNLSLAEELEVLVIGNRSGYFWEQVELVGFLKKIKSPMLINLCNTAPLFYYNQIVTIHDLAFLVHPDWFSFGFRSFYRVFIPRIVRNARHVFTVSDFSKNEIIRLLRVPSSKIDVIYNGVSFDFEMCKLKFASLQDRYILFVGSFDPRKNLSRLIDSLAFVPENIKLKVIGGKCANFNSSVICYPKVLLDRVEFLGYVNEVDLLRYYQNSICFVYPSFYEGFGLPPLEAQALGVDVVVSDIPVFHEIYGESAVFVNPNCAKDIASGINTLLAMNEGDRIELKQLAKKNIRRFSWSASSNRLWASVQKLNLSK